ncbi:hypothetical protein [Gimesia aquarii]|uniref:Uncharacterized protein n=1 Tax=Gimesia aquarii TaxID=2527964 RepID=A0A517WZF4_9PLAN|nr:hypothetical protein [Gimesia aquarii]QDT97070.1 hypothetical protein V144x_25410 [Gimesia aquarii]QDU10635.1 hypothetical protein V202x_40470 [Gimesia aquarii]
MSNDNFYSEDNDSQPDEFSAQPKPGMSKGVKVLLIILGAGSLCLLLCCGGLFYAARNMDIKMKVTEKKAEIITIQNEITEITIPETFKPMAGVTFSVVGKGMKMAMYEPVSKQGVLILMSLSVPDDGMIDMEKEFRDSLNNQNQNQNQRQLDITKEETREFMIKGKKLNFTFAEGTDQDKTKFHQVTGVFPGKGGPAFIMLQIQADEYNEEEIVKMIESIK